MLRRSAFLLARTTSFPRATLTNARFNPRATQSLIEASQNHNWKSNYWLTSAQARRSCNTTIRAGEKPTPIALEAAEVYPFDQLDADAARLILDTNPPYFGSGVGILGRLGRWNEVKAKRLVSILAMGAEQELWVDADYIQERDIVLKPGAMPVDISAQSSVLMYNADQLVEPHKGLPQEGMAISGHTGRRIPQPAHDVLLAYGTLRGYTSPYWLTEPQLDVYRVEASKVHAISAPTACGRLVPFFLLPEAIRNRFLERTVFPELLEQHDVFYTLNAAGWERTRSSTVTNALNDAITALPQSEPDVVELRSTPNKYFWINVDELQSYVDKEEEMKEVQAIAESTLAPAMVDLADVTCKTYYNACMTTEPEKVMPRFRQLHLFRGKPVGNKFEQLLRNEYVTSKYHNPLWLNRSDCKKLHVTIPESEQSKFVRLDTGGVDYGEVFNIEDVVGYEDLLKRVPVKEKPNVPQVLLVKWAVILGRQRQDLVKKQNRQLNLWVSYSEVLMANLTIKEGAKAIEFNTAVKGSSKKRYITDEDGEEDAFEGGEEEERGLTATMNELYNAHQTSDPVRVIGKSKFYSRAQGGLST